MITLGILHYASTQAWFITYDIPMREIANCMVILNNITFLVKNKVHSHFYTADQQYQPAKA